MEGLDGYMYIPINRLYQTKEWITKETTAVIVAS